MKLKGKTAIITGASKGIGRGIAQAMANEGANLVLMARSADTLEDLKSNFQSRGIECVVYAGSVANEHDVASCIQLALDIFGQIDVLINNAGVGVFKAVEDISTEEWDHTMEVNVKGTFLMTKAVIPQMKEQKHGRIINIASDVSKRTFPYGSVYCASKYAQHGFADAVRKEVLKDGIKVSTIYPGMVDTYFAGNEPGSEERAQHLKPKDIAQAVMYLLHTPDYIVVDEITLHPTEQVWWTN